MKKIVFCLMMVLGLAACGEKTDKPTTDKAVMKIGVIAPLSGNNAALGINSRRALEMALEEIPDKTVHYQIIYEDDGFQAARAASAAHKLINVDKVDAIIACSAVSGAAAAPIAAASKKFMLTTIASETDIARQSPFSFLHWTPPVVEGRLTMKLLHEKDVKKIVLFTENHPGAEAISDGILEAGKGSGIEIVPINFMSTERNFTDIVLKAQRENADMWVLITLQPGINLIGKRMQELNIKVPYTSSEIPTFMEDKSMFEGVKFVDVFDGDPQMLERYKAKYQTDNTYAAAFAYDTMVILDKLVKNFYAQNQRIPNSEELARAMANLSEHRGVVGRVTIDNDGILQSEAAVKTVKNGKIISLKE